jgi:Domain of unknown function (DUF4451)
MKPTDESSMMQSLDADMSGLDHIPFVTNDENGHLLDLRFPIPCSGIEQRGLTVKQLPQHYSGDTMPLQSASEVLDNLPHVYDDISAFSETTSYISDYTPRSSLNLSVTPLSPIASPRQPQRPELARASSRGRSSPSPRPTMRSAPYSINDNGRTKRWSTGSYAPTPLRKPSPFTFQGQDSGIHGQFNQRLPSHQSSPVMQTTQAQRPQSQYFSHSQGMGNQNMHPQGLMVSHPQFNTTGFHPHPHSRPQTQHMHQPPSFNSHFPPAFTLGSQSHQQSYDPSLTHHYNNDNGQPAMLPHGLFRMLQSNADPGFPSQHHSHYTDFSDPPDLYASIRLEPIPPPPEDMNPSDPDLVPHEQDLRFEGDLYTPRWVRGHGNKREGWCGLCRVPSTSGGDGKNSTSTGRWLVLKNSAFWYDKSFTHGVSAATGQQFAEPGEVRRMDGNPDVWEGLCGSCHEWVALVSSKKKGTTWFRHAYKVSDNIAERRNRLSKV